MPWKRHAAQVAPTYILNVPKDELTPKQCTVRLDLQDRIKSQLMHLTGQQGDHIGTDGGDEELDGGDEEGSADAPMHFNFILPVVAYQNEKIIKRAADVVWKEQTDENICDLTHKDVAFTYKDLAAFAKAYFREWRKRYQAATDPEQAEKRRQQIVLNRRAQRQKNLRDDRMKAVKLYQEKYGKDVSAVLEEGAWMSEEISGPDTDDEDVVAEHRKQLEVKAGLMQEEIESGEPIWEVRRPSFRTPEVNEIITELDVIRRQMRRDMKKMKQKQQRVTRRVNLGNMKTGPPTKPIYPFMLNTEWLKTFLEENPGSDGVLVHDENPEAFKDFEGQDT
ncbi:hypothetical protein DENSPDRAFT_887260 [Dentipellis sp. KUC8613]|nr:hypothetical protein DENSPDRAFT_887260 [Dentipellis sp. KUC8613]